MSGRFKITILVALCAVIFLSGAAAVYALPSQTTDIEKTRLGNSDTYYSFDSRKKALIISGKGGTPDFSNSSGSDDSQPWYKWKNDGSVESIIVEEGVTYLGNYIFTNCTEKSVSLPDSLEKVGSSAFSGNADITRLDLKNISYISANAFSRCFDLRTVTFSSETEYIGAAAFERCTALEAVDFESMTSNILVGQGAFLSCSALKSVKLPVGIKPSDYSFGFDKAQAGEYYDDFIMQVYRDSQAYDYAVKNGIKFELLDEMVIKAGDSVVRSYNEDNQNSAMTFTFVPERDGRYRFMSVGEVDVDCSLAEKSNPNLPLAKSEDNSRFDLNFTVEYELKKATAYCFTVTSNRSLGDFTVKLSIGADYGDFNYDGYVNAKDYAVIRSRYGFYDEDNALLSYYDKNKDGVIDEKDWECAVISN